ncbi:MAG: hypothetical protein P8Q35_05450 [Candidatus Thalassarchaeaceae archaeon]|nr:hypothetical protein [Candidatus Thalassarchaeaceae archaeon]
MNSESDTVPRVVSIFSGLFFMSFGLPFALVPFMMISDGVIDPDYPFESLFMLAFSSPFFLAGTGIMYMGARVVLMGIRGEETTPDEKFVHPESVDDPGSQIDIDEFDPLEPGKDGWWEEESES